MIDKKGAVGAIIVAAGKGSRMGLGYNKVLASLCGKPVIDWTLKSFVHSGIIDRLILVISPEDEGAMAQVCQNYIDQMEIAMVFGGEDRQDSVYNGLKALDDNVDVVLIHDGARPFIDRDLIERSVDQAHIHGAACSGMPVKETIKIVDEVNVIRSTPDRSFLWSAQTPQAFKKDIILEAYSLAFEKGIRATDDACLAERAGYSVAMFEGDYRNIKLTSSEDLLLAELFMKKQAGC